MSLTLLYRGNNVRFSMKLNKLHWLSALTVFAIISGFVVHLIMSSDATPKSAPIILQSNNSDDIQQSEVNDQQVVALTMKLAELQSQVLRLNALGDRLAEQANIPEKEFNFQALPPSGGPMLQSQTSEKNH